MGVAWSEVLGGVTHGGKGQQQWQQRLDWREEMNSQAGGAEDVAALPLASLVARALQPAGQLAEGVVSPDAAEEGGGGGPHLMTTLALITRAWG